MNYLPILIPLVGILSGHLLGDEIDISEQTTLFLRYYSIGLVLTSTAFNFIPDLKYVNEKNDKPLLISIILSSVVLMVILNKCFSQPYHPSNTDHRPVHYYVYNLFDIFATGFVIGSATMFKSKNINNLTISLTTSLFFAGLTNVHDLIKNRYNYKQKILLLLIHFATYFTGILLAHFVRNHHYIKLIVAGVCMSIIYWLMIKKMFMWENNDYVYSLLLMYIGVLTMIFIK